MPSPPYPLDALGRRVPKWLVPTFHGRRKLLAWCREVDRLKSRLTEMQEEVFAQHLDAPRARKYLDAARVLVLRAAPYLPCDCPANQHECPKCKGDRWVTAPNSPV